VRGRRGAREQHEQERAERAQTAMPRTHADFQHDGALELRC